MSFSDRKITDGEIAAHGIQGQPNKLPGPARHNKETFDALVTEVVKAKLNGLIDELVGANAAGQIGVDTVSGITAHNVQDALEAIMQSMQDITQGSVADGSITSIKLAHGAVGTAQIAALAVTGALLAAGCVSSAKLEDGAVTTDKLAALAVTAAKLAAGSVTAEKLAAGAVTTERIANAAVDNTKLAADAVTTVKIKDRAVTAAKLAAELSYTAVNLSAEQVRPIFIQNTEPTGASPDGIYLVTEE